MEAFHDYQLIRRYSPRVSSRIQYNKWISGQIQSVNTIIWHLSLPLLHYYSPIEYVSVNILFCVFIFFVLLWLSSLTSLHLKTFQEMCTRVLNDIIISLKKTATTIISINNDINKCNLFCHIKCRLWLSL